MSVRPLPKIFFLFSFLLIIHLLATFGPWSLMARQVIWLLGLLLFFFFSFLEKKPSFSGSSPEPNGSTPEPFPQWAWICLVILGITLRTLRYWLIPHWPVLDEASMAQYSVHLAQHWNWTFFYTDGEQPPLLHWATGALLKWTQLPFLSLWFPAFLASCVTLIVFVVFFRRVFNPTAAYLASAFMAIGFWPIYSQSFSLECVLLPAWESILVLLLVQVLSKDPPNRLLVFTFGFWAGSGYWTYTPWPVVSLVAFFTLWMIGRKISRSFTLIYSGAGFILSLLFFAVVAQLHGGYGTHIRGFSAFHGWHKAENVLLSSLDYINVIFWGHWSYVDYGPAYGGFLNPLLASFFWIGLWTLYREDSQRGSRWLLPAALFLLLLPGIASQDTESTRIIQIFPFLLTLSGIGAFSLWKHLPFSKIGLWVGAVVLLSLCFDLPQIDRSFQQLMTFSDQDRSIYQVLRTMTQNQGPGLFFTQFKVQTNNERELEEMFYPLNPAENDPVDWDHIRWACLLVHYDEVPYLLKRFPNSKWLRPPSSSNEERQLSVGFIPFQLKDQDLWKKWWRASRWFREVYCKTLSISNDQTYQQALKAWSTPPDEFSNDKFLESSYWEALADFYYRHGFEHNYQLQLNALKNSVTKGYPFPHLDYDLGCLLWRGGELEEAQKYLEKAHQGDPQNPDIVYALQSVKTQNMKNEPR